MNLFELSVKIKAEDTASATMKKTQGVSETLANKIKVMSAQFESAQKNVDKLTKEFNESVNKAGAADKATQELAKKLSKAEKEAGKFAKELDAVQKEAEQSEKALDDCNEEIEDTGKTASKSGAELSSFAEKLGNGLKTAAKIVTAAVGAAAAGITALTTAAVNSFAEYEQLAGGAQKIFDQMDYSKIANDANNAYKELGLSANQYLAVINDVGATFAATMGDEAGYEAAKTGLKAISDYASGTGKNVDELSQKFTLITRSISSYQSIADQFSGILPATSDAFLEQAQAAGILSDNYTKLTEVPIDEYQAAVSQMLQQGVTDLGLANNTMNEAFSTLSGSLSMAKGAWSNLVTGLADDSADLDMLIGNFVESAGAVATNLIPKIGMALNGASKLVRDLIPVIVQEIPTLIEESLPILAEAAISIIKSLVDGISQNQAMLMTTAFETITYLANSLIKMLPQIVQLGLDLIVSLANGIAQSLPTLIPTIIDVVLKIVETLTNQETLTQLLGAAFTIITELAWGLIDNIDKLLDSVFLLIDGMIDFLLRPANLAMLIETAIELVLAIGTGIIKAIPKLLVSVGSLIGSIFTNFATADWASIGKDLVAGFKKGISNAWKNLKKWFKNLFGDLVDIAKKILGIASPSKVFKKIGGFTAEGFGIGFEDEFAKVKDDMEDALNFDDASVGINASIRKVGAGAAGGAFGGTSIGNININIDGAKYSDEQSLASAIALEIQNMTDRRAAVYA